MPTTWIVATLAALAMVPDGLGAQLAQRAARKVVSEVVQDGIGDALKDAALDAALDTAVDNSVPEFASSAREMDRDVAMGAVAGDGVDAAMRAADVAKTLDRAADAANAVKKLKKIGKLKR